ncbi:hypothetical protein Airi02_103650 [Actinoallomurus iriomotensis]|uniref:Uncharacterized protein n=2 Tax=Actinoallomurus iriomotensis TaxID=478107 RepID=A0A9W6W6W7_9ACTN|nr:hypothetical protein Airi02_103650 [Actinoallomurus iriomotensis]
MFGRARKSSMWPMAFNLACRGMELMAVGDPRNDFSRASACSAVGQRRRAAPSGSAVGQRRRADLMVVVGRVSQDHGAHRHAQIVAETLALFTDSRWWTCGDPAGAPAMRPGLRPVSADVCGDDPRALQ